MWYVMVIALLFSPTAAEADPTTEEVLRAFCSEPWRQVVDARTNLLKRGKGAIPLLLSAMQRNEKVKLRDTGDLIYPGAAAVYGHGFVVLYDIDWLPARAGWVLEALTFENFGFQTGLMVNGDAESPEITSYRWKLATHKASSWWSARGATWSREQAILDALDCDDVQRQGSVLHYLRFGDGYEPRDRWKPALAAEVLLPHVERLCASTNELVRDQAKRLREEITPPPVRLLTICGISCGMTPAQVQAIMGGRDQTVENRGAGTMWRYTSGPVSVLFQKGVVEGIWGPKIEEKGRVLCNAGDFLTSAEDALGVIDRELHPRHYDYDYYTFAPARLSVHFSKGRITRFALMRNVITSE